MQRGRAQLGCLLSAVLLTTGPLAAQQPPVNDQSVQDAVDRAVAWLKSRRNEQGHWERGSDTNARYWAGDSALALLALLSAGEDPRQAEINATLNWLADQPLRATYTRAVRAQVFAVVPGGQFRRQLREDLLWLVEAVHPAGSKHAGAYDYLSMRGARGGRYDNSNSQFGVLGVWLATEAGARVEGLPEYWKLVEEHWLRTQNPDGGWSYQDRQPSTGSMTAAGLSSLYIVLDRRHALTGHQRAEDVIAALDRGLDWLAREFTPNNPHGSSGWKYYYLYGVERAGHASGRKYFRGRDWFRIGAAELLAEQEPDGSWQTDLHDTCFALMFLAHGRAPLLFNKLEHGADWNNYLRDVAGLARYASHTFERLLNWQIVSLDGTLEDLLEAPVLYLSGRTGWEFDRQQLDRLREYCRRGGMIFAVVQEKGSEFERTVRTLAATLFPQHPLHRLPADHPLFSGQVQFPISPPPEIYEVHNGVRTLLLLSSEDVAAAWNRYRVGGGARELRLGCNVYLYATDKTTIRSRLKSATLERRPTVGQRKIEVVRIRHEAGWDVEPFGWERLAAYMDNEVGVRLVPVAGITLDSPLLQDFRVAHITGTGALTLSAAERAGLRRFLTGGGTLLADAAGGAPEFMRSLEEQLTALLHVEPRSLPADSPILTGKGLPGAVALDAVGYRRALRRPDPSRRLPALRAYLLGERAAVICSPLDISVGLLGTPVYECRGYDPDSALRVMRNLLLYASLSTAEKRRLSAP